MMKKQTYIFVDVLRGLAATLVVVYHIAVLCKWNGIPEHGFLRIFRTGWIGVDMFFVISGFVISLSVLHGMANGKSSVFFKTFVRHRLARIVPLYVLTSLVIAIFVDIHFWQLPSRWRLENVGTHLFFIHNLFPAYAGALNGAAWSLGVEMQFYILIALLLPFWPRHRALSLALLGIVMSILWRTFCWHHWQGNATMTMHAASQIIGCLNAFFMGAALALITYNRGHFLHAYMQPGARNAGLWLLAATLCGTAAWHIFWPRAGYWHLAGMVIGWRTLLTLAFTLYLVCAITLPENKYTVLAFIPALYLGKISYGIYLWHLPVITSLMKMNLSAGRMAALTALLTLLLAACSWHFFEKPLIDTYRAKRAE